MKIPRRKKAFPVCANCGRPIEGEPAQVAVGGLRPKWQTYHQECAETAVVDVFDALGREGDGPGSGHRD
jgi:hypothetical protein